MEHLAKMAAAYLEGYTTAKEFRDSLVLALCYSQEPDKDLITEIAGLLYHANKQ